MRASLASRTIVGLPSISLVPCISNESREDRKQVDYIGVVILEGNGLIAWIRHVMGDNLGRAATRGERDEGKRQSNTWLLYLNRAVVHALAREWRGLEDHCSDLSRPPSRVESALFFFFESSHNHNNTVMVIRLVWSEKR